MCLYFDLIFEDIAYFLYFYSISTAGNIVKKFKFLRVGGAPHSTLKTTLKTICTRWSWIAGNWSCCQTRKHLQKQNKTTIKMIITASFIFIRFIIIYYLLSFIIIYYYELFIVFNVWNESLKWITLSWFQNDFSLFGRDVAIDPAIGRNDASLTVSIAINGITDITDLGMEFPPAEWVIHGNRSDWSEWSERSERSEWLEWLPECWMRSFELIFHLLLASVGNLQTIFINRGQFAGEVVALGNRASHVNLNATECQ